MCCQGKVPTVHCYTPIIICHPSQLVTWISLLIVGVLKGMNPLHSVSKVMRCQIPLSPSYISPTPLELLRQRKRKRTTSLQMLSEIELSCLPLVSISPIMIRPVWSLNKTCPSTKWKGNSDITLSSYQLWFIERLIMMSWSESLSMVHRQQLALTPWRIWCSLNSLRDCLKGIVFIDR